MKPSEILQSHKVMTCKEKIEAQHDSTKALKLVYQWVRQKHITFKEFEELVEYINCADMNGGWL